MFWDEDNRLMVLSDNGKTSRYTYNAGGERIIKSHGSMEGVYINGAPQGITFHETDEFTLYPASIITVNRHRFIKHYFIGDKRVASRIGQGEFRNVYGHNGNNVTAGQQDYAERMNQIENQREAYYRKAGVAPGLPTMNGGYADPEVTGVGYNVLIDSLGDHSVPENWVQHPVINTEAGSNPGAPLAWGSPENPDDVVAGYGYVAADTSEVEETFYYHSDHLGSTAYITDQKANVTQYDAYLPYGELLVDEHSSSEEMPYKFNGKELDEETGLYYYGARYMNPVTSMWYGVDPLCEKYYSTSPYVYCLNSPILLIDPDGRDPKTKNRICGAIQMLGGALEMVGSGAGEYFSGGTASPAAIPVFMNGIDNFQAGFKQVWTGEEQETYLHQGIENAATSVGASQNASMLIAAAVDISTGCKSPQKFNRAISTADKMLTNGHQFSVASKYGFGSYNALKSKVGKNSGLQVHHIIEQRFAGLFNVKKGDMLSIVLTKEEHAAFTKAWRNEIGYINDSKSLRTDNAKQQHVIDAAKKYTKIIRKY